MLSGEEEEFEEETRWEAASASDAAAASAPDDAPRAVNVAFVEFESIPSLPFPAALLGDAGSRFSPLLTSLARRTARKTLAAAMASESSAATERATQATLASAPQKEKEDEGEGFPPPGWPPP